MASKPLMTTVERAERHKRVVAVYAELKSSRAVAKRFGLSKTHVGNIVKLYGVARPVGRPRRA